MMIKNMNEVPQSILILNNAPASNCMHEAYSPNQLLFKQKTKKNKQGCNNTNNLNMNFVCQPCFVIPQSSLISFLVEPNQLAKDQSDSILKKNPFTPEEDELLLKLVNQYGAHDWKSISILMKKWDYNRNVRQCKDRYFHYLDPKIKQSSEWTKEEDDLLLQKVVEMGNKWKSMESIFPGRTEISLRNRYKLLLRKESREERKKKKNIMSDDFSFLDNIQTKNGKNKEKIKEDTNNFRCEGVFDDPKGNISNEFYSSNCFNNDLFFGASLDQDPQIWIDEEYLPNEEFF